MRNDELFNNNLSDEEEIELLEAMIVRHVDIPVEFCGCDGCNRLRTENEFSQNRKLYLKMLRGIRKEGR